MSVHALGEHVGREPFVFLPAHRTYLDSLVLAEALRSAGLPRPWRLAGANLAFWPLGPIARRAGTVFIRREFGTDPAYHAQVRDCLADLLSRGQSVEWYPEAGRSRTGRLRKLRTGMLRILVAAYAESGIEDVRIVPVSIGYDAVPDLESVTAEDAGAAKQPEGVRALIRYAWSGRRLGPRRAWVVFGDSISLRDLSAQAPSQWHAVRTLTRHVESGLRETTRVTAESLLAIAFAATRSGPISAEDLAGQVAALVEYAMRRRIPVCRPLSVASALEGLVRTRVIERRGIAAYAVCAGRERILAYHQNIAEHWFLPRAAAELVAGGAVTTRRISALLAQAEGFEQRVEQELVVLQSEGERQPFLLAPRLLGPIFTAYHDVARDWATGQATGRATDQATDPATCRALDPAADGAGITAASTELRDAGLALLAAEGLLAEGAEPSAGEAFARELECLVHRLRAMSALDGNARAGVADVRG